MNEIINYISKINDLTNFWNAKLVFIKTDGKSATVKVLAQNITTPEITIHPEMDEEEIKVLIGYEIQKTKGVTHVRI